MKAKSINPDTIGIMASTLCLIHCVATPFIFLAKACSVSCCANAPVWWKGIDFLFIIISFVAIFYAAKNTSKSWMPMALWSSWLVLLVTIFCETLGANFLPPKFVYIPSIGIVILHLYNHKYCRCKENDCCVK